MLDETAPEAAASLRARYAPSPIREPMVLSDTTPEREGSISRRAMSVVDEAAEGEVRNGMEVE